MHERPASVAEGLDIPVAQVILHTQIAQAVYRMHIIMSVEVVLFSLGAEVFLSSQTVSSIQSYYAVALSPVSKAAEEPVSSENKGRFPSRIRDGLPF